MRASRSTASSTGRSGTGAHCSRSSRSSSSTGIVTDSGAPEDEVEAWRAAGVDVVTADPGPREPPPVRPRDLRRAVRNDGAGRLMPTLAAVDLGAQSGRVAVGTVRRRAPRRRRGAPVRERAGRRRRHAALGRRRASTRDVAGRPARGRARAARRSVAVDSWAVDFGLDRRGRAAARRTPSTTATRGAPPPFERVLERVPPRELYERTGIQLLPINTIFELAAMAAEARPGARRARETLLLIPDLFHYWLCGSTHDRAHERDHDAVLRPARGRPGPPICSSGSAFRRGCSPRSSRPATPLGRAPRVADATGLGDATVVAVATHDTGSAVAAVPFGGDRLARTSASARGRSSGVEVDRPLITDATFAANLTNEGGVDGTFRLLRNVTGLWLAARVPPRLGGRRPRPLVRRAGRARGGRAALQSLIDPERRVVRRARRHAGAHRRLLRAHRAAGARTTRRGRPLHSREPRAEAGRDRRHARRRHRARARRAARRRRRRAQRAALRVDGARPPACPVLAGPDEATLVGNLLVQAMALGEVGVARRGARGRPPLVRPGRLRADADAGLGRGAGALRRAGASPTPPSRCAA